MSKWFYLGRWDSPLICQSFFAHYYYENAFRDAGIPLISGGYKVVDYEVFVIEKDKRNIENFFYSQIVKKDFEKLFLFVKKAKEAGLAAFVFTTTEKFRSDLKSIGINA